MTGTIGSGPGDSGHVDWAPYPDSRFESLLRQGSAQALLDALRGPPATVDRFAHLRLLDRLRELQPGHPDLLAAWIPAMLMSNRPAPVYEVTRRWPLQGGPAPGWRLVAAQVAQTMGAHDEASARFRALLDDCPGMIDAWQKYVEFASPAGLSAGDVALVQALFEGASDDYVREKAAFALATAWQTKEPQAAFRMAAIAHGLRRSRHGPWDADAVERRLEADRARTPAPEGAPVVEPRPVFVVGLPRSGTTLLTRMLGSHGAIAGVGEQPLVPLWAAIEGSVATAAPDGVPFAQAWYRAAVRDLAPGARATVDKLPVNAEFVGLILETFPDALVVWLERDLADCAMSMYLHDFETGLQFVDDPADLARYALLLRQHLLHWQARAPARALHVRYEQLVENPQATLEPLLAALGLQWEPAMLDFWKAGEQIATYSESQVRKPLHRGAIGAWRRFLPQATGFVRSLGVAD